MVTKTFGIKIFHPQLGSLLSENFVNGTQFKLFLKMINGCLELKNDLTFFNGTDFLVHIPNEILVKSVITTNVDEINFTEVVKSKVEALETK